jgi:hypothetical protein
MHRQDQYQPDPCIVAGRLRAHKAIVKKGVMSLLLDILDNEPEDAAILRRWGPKALPPTRWLTRGGQNRERDPDKRSSAADQVRPSA